MMGKSRMGLALFAAKLEVAVPQASVLQVHHFGNRPSFHSTEAVNGTEF